MSNEASAWAFAQNAGGTGPKLLLVALANNCGKDGVTFLGRKRLAEECECRDATVTANMAKLEERGLVARLQRRRENGSRTSDWTILAPGWEDRGSMVAPLAEERCQEVVDLAIGSGAVSAPEEGSGAVFVPGQVRFSGGPELLEEPVVLPPTPQDGKSAAFEAWLEHHEAVTKLRPSKPKTRAREELQRSFFARLAEGWTLDDLKHATIGAHMDEWRREHGYDAASSVLRPTKIGDLVAKGQRARASKRSVDQSYQAQNARALQRAEAARQRKIVMEREMAAAVGA